jgi:hypothetical protein
MRPVAVRRPWERQRGARPSPRVPRRDRRRRDRRRRHSAGTRASRLAAANHVLLSCCHVAATHDEISEDQAGPIGTTARRNHAWSLQVRELFEFSHHVEPGSNPFSRSI